ncbi:MAG: hypothetical protein DRJ03_28385 [Chloroflexi bacterium]|nr:MAG: hypothetical protein DRI81_16625 [Chloroflexota bacterium]RLC76573.1 MAG: hypothetical protein DRJ03_28385 [Chloroflexota bacterium]
MHNSRLCGNNEVVGECFADLLVAGVVIVELKAMKKLLERHIYRDALLRNSFLEKPKTPPSLFLVTGVWQIFRMPTSWGRQQ